MSYKNQLIELREGEDGEARDNRSGVTQAIVEIFEQAITAGELGPGAKLPPTRQPRRAHGRQPPDGGPRVSPAR